MGKHSNMMLGGHRGMGENLATTSVDGRSSVYPAFRENTIQSFQRAAKCGVEFVEFDVQVTRDNVPVIWHDDDVVLGSPDHPSRPQIKDLTLAELQTLCGPRRTAAAAAAVENAVGTAVDSSSSSACSKGAGGAGERLVAVGDCVRGVSGRTDQVQPPSELLRRFRDRSTRQWTSGYAPWTCDEDDTIPTLEAVFSALPPEVGFDIEIKMTTGDDVVHTPADEVNRMLAAILPVVDRCAGKHSPSASPLPASAYPSTNSSPAHPITTIAGDPAGGGSDCCPRRRHIMYSSFDPDVCLELRRRQAAHPVYYLSGCGLYEHADARRTSIPAALSFAAEAGMRGIVLPASILLKNMDMVGSASRSHLELMTYGLENNDLDCLQAQADAGVVAAIVDEVAGVTAALGAADATETELKQAEAGQPPTGAPAVAAVAEARLEGEVQGEVAKHPAKWAQRVVGEGEAARS